MAKKTKQEFKVTVAFIFQSAGPEGQWWRICEGKSPLYTSACISNTLILSMCDFLLQQYCLSLFLLLDKILSVSSSGTILSKG